MKILGSAAVLITAIGAIAAGSNISSTQSRVPVLLELFTSEGCSSCPPADQLLEKLDREQSVAGADLIVLSEHVDYWNHLGWADPYSSPLFSARQEEYSRRLGVSEIYTPQLVIDGRAETVGSDRYAVLKAISRSLSRQKVALSLSAARSSVGATLHISAPQAQADLYVILALDHARSSVLRGENKGRDLEHVAVAYSVMRIGQWSGDRDVHVPLKPGAMRAIAVLQDPKTAGVIGAAQTRF